MLEDNKENIANIATTSTLLYSHICIKTNTDKETLKREANKFCEEKYANKVSFIKSL